MNPPPLPPPVTNVPDHAPDGRFVASELDPGSPYLTEEEYRQEYEALSSRMHHRSVPAVSLSHAEVHQCAEYLGVFPEDLGMRLEEFNELLLEQALVTSALEDSQRLNNNNSDPVSTEMSFAADLDGDGMGSQRPDTPHPATRIVQADELTQRVHRWVNEAADGSWELVSSNVDGQENGTRTTQNMESPEQFCYHETSPYVTVPPEIDGSTYEEVHSEDGGEEVIHENQVMHRLAGDESLEVAHGIASEIEIQSMSGAPVQANVMPRGATASDVLLASEETCVDSCTPAISETDRHQRWMMEEEPENFLACGRT